MKRKFLVTLLAVTMTVGLFTGCGKEADEASASETPDTETVAGAEEVPENEGAETGGETNVPEDSIKPDAGFAEIEALNLDAEMEKILKAYQQYMNENKIEKCMLLEVESYNKPILICYGTREYDDYYGSHVRGEGRIVATYNNGEVKVAEECFDLRLGYHPNGIFHRLTGNASAEYIYYMNEKGELELKAYYELEEDNKTHYYVGDKEGTIDDFDAFLESNNATPENYTEIFEDTIIYNRVAEAYQNK